MTDTAIKPWKRPKDHDPYRQGYEQGRIEGIREGQMKTAKARQSVKAAGMKDKLVKRMTDAVEELADCGWQLTSVKTSAQSITIYVKAIK